MTPLTIIDDLGNRLSFESPPQRVVSLVPSLTETLLCLGARGRLVGRTEYCVRPFNEVANIATVGGTKTPSIEAILALRPDCVIANAEENEEECVEALRERAAVFVTFPRTVEGAIKTVEDLGSILGSPRRPKAMRASNIAGSWALECRHARAKIIGRSLRTRLRTACLIWRDPWMAAGADTYMSDLLATCGFDNVFVPGDGRYPETTIDALIARSPDVVLLPDEPYRFDDTHREEICPPFLRASLSPRILLVDGTKLAWYGWRTLNSLAYVAALRERLEA
jgi:iron complex transport system substrate-binding protein